MHVKGTAQLPAAWVRSLEVGSRNNDDERERIHFTADDPSSSACGPKLSSAQLTMVDEATRFLTLPGHLSGPRGQHDAREDGAESTAAEIVK